MIAPSTIVGTLGAAFVIGGVAGALLTLQNSTPGIGGPNISTAADQPYVPTPGPMRAPAPTAAPTATTAKAVKQSDGRIVISGVLSGAHSGDELTVQRREDGGWQDFPASAHSGPGGKFSLWVRTERSAAFRVRDERTGAVSEPTQSG